jgi:dephospho-CoA kinase
VAAESGGTRPGLRLVGLTGGIGSGKSTVARLIAARGIPVLDADLLAREATVPGSPALAEIGAIWPETLALDGRLDRGKLGAAVFADAAARARLEAILHPRIAALADARAAALAAAGHRLAFYEASLLVETGRHRELDGLVVVTAPEPLRIARAMARAASATEADVRARLAAQLPDEEKVRVATHVIHNDGDLAALAEKVDALVAALAGQAPAAWRP